MMPLSGFAALALLTGASSGLPDFELSTLRGVTVPSAELSAGAKVTVVAFIAAKCPVSQMYQARMNRIYSEYAGKGVAFVFVDSNSNESAAEIEKWAAESRIVFPVYKDYGNRAADLLGAQTTPEMFVYDASGALRYRGAIDDASNEARVKTRGLRDAIDAVLAGRSPKVAGLKAFGCVLHRESKKGTTEP